MDCSLIVATLGRTAELQRLLQSLAGQTYRDFEVIVVDQNGDERLTDLLAVFRPSFPIRHLRAAPGLSRARNLGWQQAAGALLAFPDDDCWYPQDLLKQVHDTLRDHPAWDGLIGYGVDEQGRANLPWREKSGPVSPAVSWRRSVTYAMFLRRDVVQRVGGFDETLGPGAGTPWGSGEDNDLMLRALAGGARVQFDATLRVGHPRLFLAPDAAGCAKRHRYALGDGRLLRKHPMPWWWRALFFGVPLGRLAGAALRGRGAAVRFHWVTFQGRRQGYRAGRGAAGARSKPATIN